MASEEHLEILRQGVDAWNHWRAENPDIRPDLREARLMCADLRRADLHGTNLHGADLCDTDLNGIVLDDADLRETNLVRAQMCNASLVSADLEGTRLSRANLSRSNLASSNLSRAEFCHADLNGASLEHAMLAGTIFVGCDLAFANLSHTGFGGSRRSFGYVSNVRRSPTILAGIDLSQVNGLEQVYHRGPSHLSTDTLALSRGGIPEAFLRGCGLSDWQIESAKLYDPDLSERDITTIAYELVRLRSLGTAISYYSSFISYSHADKSFARRLHDQLQARGIRCWLDEHQLLPGDDIYDMVDRGIRLWDKVLLCCSGKSLASWWVNDEIDKALEKERKLLKGRGEKVLAIIPLNLDGYLFEWQDGRAATLRKRLAADFAGWEHNNAKFEEQFEKVVKALRTEGREKAPKSKL